MSNSNKNRFKHSSVSLGYSDLVDSTTESGRIYITPEGKHYPSITTVLGSFGKEGILEWRNSVGAAEADRITRHACARGTALHKIAERYLNNEENIYDKNEMPHVKALWNSIKPIIDKNISTVVLQECPLYSDHFGIAGRVDLIAEYDGVYSVVDFKTARRRKTADEISNYFTQAAFYAAAFYERTGIPITQSIILMAVDNDPNPIVFKENTYKWLKNLNSIIKQYNAKKLFGHI
jgi:genome maintenance exonuclease 1